jgi:hypothetical protein
VSTQAAPAPPSAMSRALARDRLGVPAVLAFILAGVAPLTVAAGVIPSAYATTGLTGIPAAFIVIAVTLALFATGYMAMSRRITNAGAFYKAHMFARTCVRFRLEFHGFGRWCQGVADLRFLRNRHYHMWQAALVSRRRGGW